MGKNQSSKKEYKGKRKSKHTVPMLQGLQKIYAKEYGKAEICSYTDLEKSLYRNILTVKDEKELHELELQTKTQIECRERSNIIAGGSLCLSVFALFITVLTNIANANGKINEIAFLLLALIYFSLILVHIIVNGYSYDRHAIPYYKLKLQCIEKVKEEMEEQKKQANQSKSTKKSKKN